MIDQKMYLKQNVVLEPLINQWYAWPYLIPPVTSAMYLAHSHLKIMESFVTSQQLHSSALQDPKMIGGPFINYGVSKVDEIKALMEKTKQEQAHMLELAEAVKTLDQMLEDEANGYSLEPIYENIPEILKGYVELVYDLKNNCSMRFIEGLLYKSKYYNKSRQSISLSLINDDRRNFVLSTPRLEDDRCIHLNISLDSEVIDELMKMKNVSNYLENVKKKIPVCDDKYHLFESFFTEELPKTIPTYNGDSIRIRYFGHACILIESKDISILCDPIISYKYDSAIPRYTYADLPESIDYVLITHNHQDHCLFETLLQLRHKIKKAIVPKNNCGSLVDPSLKLILQNIGFKKENIQEVDDMDTIDIEGGLITSLPFLGEHGDLNIKTKNAYVIELKGKSILIGADSNNLEPKIYEYVHDFLRKDLDILFLGMECDGGPLTWLYGSLFTKKIPRKMDQSRRVNGSNYQKAINIVNRLNPKQVYVYAMGQEPWLTYITSIRYTEESSPIIESNKLLDDCIKRGIVAERLFGQKEIILR